MSTIFSHLGRVTLTACHSAVPTGYSADKQFLVLGVRLEDGQTLADYNIKPDTVLHMRLKSQEAPATQEVPQQGGSK